MPKGSGPGPSRQTAIRFDVDQSWAVYHVFSSGPARVDGQTMTGLSWLIATNGMHRSTANGSGATRYEAISCHAPRSNDLQ